MTPTPSSQPRSRVGQLAEVVGVALFYAVVTLVVTWPQGAAITTLSHGHHDALFSMWRLSWIAQALSSPTAHLFDAPIFVPVTGTLAFSDAVLLQGVIGWPWIAAGVPALTVYNVLLLGGMWASAVGAYVLSRRLTGSGAAALVAGTIFGFAPYRLEHAMHLELQWSQWMPLTLWALHRTWSSARLRDGALTGVFLALQFLSCIYYGIFLALFLALLTPALLWWRIPRQPARTAAALALGVMLALPPVIAYARPYRENQQTLGGRSADEIAQWSARPSSYLSAPPENRLYGRWTASLGTPEGRLFPGILAIGLAVVAWGSAAPTRRLVAVYTWGLAWAMVLSFGTHAPVYGAMLHVLPPLEGLRAPARFAMLVLLALSVLAACGCKLLASRIETASSRQTRGRRGAGYATALVATLAVIGTTVEYASAFGPLHPWPREAPLYTRWLSSQPAGGVVEFPVPRGDGLPLYEAEWSFLGTFHRHPLVNGYSGYFPRPYLDLLGALDGFPSEESLWVLERRDVRYVVLHEDRYTPAAFLRLLGRIEQFPCFTRVGRFPDAVYPVSVYLVCPQEQE